MFLVHLSRRAADSRHSSSGRNLPDMDGLGTRGDLSVAPIAAASSSAFVLATVVQGWRGTAGVARAVSDRSRCSARVEGASSLRRLHRAHRRRVTLRLWIRVRREPAQPRGQSMEVGLRVRYDDSARERRNKHMIFADVTISRTARSAGVAGEVRLPHPSMPTTEVDIGRRSSPST
jgi:hypothetical protein